MGYLGNSQLISDDLSCAFVYLVFWLVDRNGLSSGLIKKTGFIEGKGWGSAFFFNGSFLLQQNSQCPPMDAL